jgi:hypothetical protein
MQIVEQYIVKVSHLFCLRQFFYSNLLVIFGRCSNVNVRIHVVVHDQFHELGRGSRQEEFTQLAQHQHVRRGGDLRANDRF